MLVKFAFVGMNAMVSIKTIALYVKVIKRRKQMSNEMDTRKLKVCCICGNYFEGFGNNPAPIRLEGVCCTDCNSELVIPARIIGIYRSKERN